MGKTTTAVNVAAALALAGQRTLLVDLDPQGSVGRALGLELDGSPGSSAAFRGRGELRAVLPDPARALPPRRRARRRGARRGGARPARRHRPAGAAAPDARPRCATTGRRRARHAAGAGRPERRRAAARRRRAGARRRRLPRGGGAPRHAGRRAARREGARHPLRAPRHPADVRRPPAQRRASRRGPAARALPRPRAEVVDPRLGPLRLGRAGRRPRRRRGAWLDRPPRPTAPPPASCSAALGAARPPSARR